ncbi:oxygenase MpaB family protein [Natrinema sp. 1APR25-10V2]|uniref:oxygenase MpaB family protein n=1 Tax=Natrinema sp. 1APR25-10V2 TaxID=2951081 RepID=UPI0028752F24|nr:oxygenase MpaB family protein [Natrinema sp. 1APR25-10V2]MDS0477063.1 DUF2236 domain-containing protein [Natrinema sp. 1APR25-10V2]
MDRSGHDGIDPSLSEAISPDIAALVADLETHETGFFGPDSIMWRVSREKVLLLSGVSTILLQFAHPLVAAGVAEHSRFDASPIGRFRRTFDFVHAIIFGDADAAIEAALTIREIHGQVTGTLEEDVGPFVAGERYAAATPELLLWVHATLIDQALTAYETYVAPLPETEQAEYYQESKVFGRLLGIPEEAYPETLADFYDYYERMLVEELTVGTQGKKLQRTLFRQGHVFGPLYAFLGAGTLPDSVRAEFQLPWSPRRQRIFEAVCALARSVVRSLPARLRYVDAYRHAQIRLQ